MTRPALHIAVSVDAPADAPRDQLAEMQAASAELRREEVAAFVAILVIAQDMAAVIGDQARGHKPGVAESARRLLRPLHTEELNLLALTERSEGDERLARRKAEGFR